MFGALAAMLLLMSQPVSEPPVRAEALSPGVAYLQSGQSGGGARWQNKWQGWQSGTVLNAEISESELNSWAQQNWGAQGQDQGDPWFSWHQPNFRISSDNELQLALVLRADPPGYTREVSFWAIGRFEENTSVWSIHDGQAWIGQFPLGKVPVIGHWAAMRLIQNAMETNVAEEYQSAWGSPRAVVVDNQRIMVRR